MALTGAHAPGATALTEEDIRGLKLASITTQGELNGFVRYARSSANTSARIAFMPPAMCADAFAPRSVDVIRGVSRRRLSSLFSESVFATGG
jgi:hypothetical protein